MKNLFEINNGLLKKLAKENIIFIIGMIVLSPIVAFLKGLEGVPMDWLMAKIFVFVMLVWNIPAIFLLAHYFFKNRNAKLWIDETNKVFSIDENGLIKEYHFDQIKSATFNLGIYHKNKIDNSSRSKMLISDFGYLDLLMENGNRYSFTSLMIDFLHKKSFLPNTKYRYRFLPFVDKFDSKQLKKREKKPNHSRTEMFIEQYRTKTIQELKEILKNEKSYQLEAVEAAKFLIKNKKVE